MWQNGKEVAHEPQANVLLMFLPTFDVFRNRLLHRSTATWNLLVLYNDQRSKKTDTHTWIVPLDCSRISASLGQTLFLVSASFFVCLLSPSLVYGFCNKFFNVFTCLKRNNAENILQNSESLVTMTHDGNCCEVFLQFRYSQVVIKNSFWLHFSRFRPCK